MNGITNQLKFVLLTFKTEDVHHSALWPQIELSCSQLRFWKRDFVLWVHSWREIHSGQRTLCVSNMHIHERVYTYMSAYTHMHKKWSHKNAIPQKICVLSSCFALPLSGFVYQDCKGIPVSLLLQRPLKWQQSWPGVISDVLSHLMNLQPSRSECHTIWRLP